MKSLLMYFCAISLIFLGVGANNFVSASEEQGGTAKLMDIKSFVHQTYFHGVPYQEASKYGSDVVPVLLEMLDDPTEKEFWANEVITLCIIGDEKAVDPIIAFINKNAQGEISESHYTAKTSAIMALGYLINKSGSKKALEYLKECINPGVWTERKLSWRSPYQASVDDRDEHLSTMAVLGLALSGNPEALRSLQQPAVSSRGQKFQAQVSDVISEAVKANKKIAKEGLIEYYKSSGQ
ncbi:MAG: hypothetical protein GY777_08345 [Candidatus Brocadiaceae bacterium]|nr:hypothetical protein [Candidatus Brocadiaceae bacterium]